MGCARDDLERIDPFHSAQGILVQLQHAGISAAYNQKRRRANSFERIVRQIWPPATGNNRADPLAQRRSRDDGRSCPGAGAEQFDELCARELAEIERRREFYVGGTPPQSLRGRTAIVIDDGLATGNTMHAALKAARLREPKMLVMAVPVAPPGMMDSFQGEADKIVCLATPEPFGAVGYFYQDFHQVSDDEVIQLLARGRRRYAEPGLAAINGGTYGP